MWADVLGEKPVIYYDFRQEELKQNKIPKGKHLLTSLEIREQGRLP